MQIEHQNPFKRVYVVSVDQDMRLIGEKQTDPAKPGTNVYLGVRLKINGHNPLNLIWDGTELMTIFLDPLNSSYYAAVQPIDEEVRKFTDETIQAYIQTGWNGE